MTEELDELLKTCENRLEQDTELMNAAREQLSDIDHIIAHLENTQPQGGGVDSSSLQVALEEARGQRQQTEDLLETLEARHAETKARYEQLTERLSDVSE